MDLEDINHSRSKAESPQTNGICERFHRTIQDEFYSILFRRKVFRSIEELQAELDEWIGWYNTKRTHSGKYCYGKTPWETLVSTKHLTLEKQVDELPWQNNRVGEDNVQPTESIFELNAEQTAPEEPNSDELNLTTKINF